MPFVLMTFGLGMVVGNIVGGRAADISVLGTMYVGVSAITCALFLFSFAVRNEITMFIGLFIISATCSMLFPAVQMRLIRFASDGKSLASSLIHSAFNIANAMDASLGGLVIAAGWGYTAPALVGAGLAVLGLGVIIVSMGMERRSEAGAEMYPSDADVIVPSY